MKILLSNDDGVYAPGLKILFETLSMIATVFVVAPDRDRSAAGKSLTLSSPIRPRVLENGFISVEGTPTDCVHLATTGLLDEKLDMVVAGINAGANLGDDVLYSGTVAAASEGRFLGMPSVAVSMAGIGENYKTAAIVAKQVVSSIMKNSDQTLLPDTVLNVNVPDVPLESIKGIKVTRLGRRHQAEAMIRTTDPRGEPVYWVGPSGPEQDAGPGTDFYAVKNSYVSVTPLDMDLTRYSSMESVTEWASDLSME